MRDCDGTMSSVQNNPSANSQELRTRPGARLEVLALCIGNALGFAGSGSIPLWVAEMIKAGTLPTSQIGWLASGELFLLALSVLAVSAWGKQASPRKVAATAAVVVVLANVVAMVPAVPAVVIGRLLSGIAMGAILAAVTRVAARRPDAQRVLALMQAAMVVVVSILFFVSPTLIERFGVAGLFAIIAVTAVVGAIASLAGLPSTIAVHTAVVQAVRTSKLAPILGCLALAGVFVGQNMLWTYIVTIGNGLGFDGRTLGSVLAIVPPLAMLGPLAAHALGERLGLLWPLLLGLVLLGIDFFFVVGAGSLIQFCIFAAVLNVAILFFVPYGITLLSRLDASGRFAGAAPAFMMIGGAISPALGSRVLEMSQVQTLAPVAAACVALSIVLFLAAALLGGIRVSARDIFASAAIPKQPE